MHAAILEVYSVTQCERKSECRNLKKFLCYGYLQTAVFRLMYNPTHTTVCKHA